MEKVHYCTDCGRTYMGISVCPYCLSDNFVYLRASKPIEENWSGIWEQISNKE